MFGKTIRRSRHCAEVRALRLVVGMLEHEALQTHQKITVRPDGRPHAVVVWFLWDGESILIFSRPNNQKVRNLQHNSNVVLAKDNTHEGSDPITIEGIAALLKPGEVNTAQPGFVEKYGEHIKRIGYTLEEMAAEYSQPIRIIPTRVM
jgi:PPOX class probable F420-dependent enzyme